MTNTNDTGGVKVKPLEWVEADYWPGVKSHEAKGCGFSYWIIDRDGGCDVACRNDGWTLSSLASVDKAKAAAQADYEARIRSAIEPPKPEVAGLDERALELGKAAFFDANNEIKQCSMCHGAGRMPDESDCPVCQGGCFVAPPGWDPYASLIRAYLSALPASPDGEKAVLPCDVHLPPATILRKGVSLSALLAGLKARGMNLPDPPPTPEAGKYADGVLAETMWAEVVANYDGDGVEWRCAELSGMDTHVMPRLELAADTFPVGTRLSISEPTEEPATP
jgi:hypothetical protein